MYKKNWQEIAERTLKPDHRINLDQTGRVANSIRHYSQEAFREGQKSVRDSIKLALDISGEEDEQ